MLQVATYTSPAFAADIIYGIEHYRVLVWPGLKLSVICYTLLVQYIAVAPMVAVGSFMIGLDQTYVDRFDSLAPLNSDGTIFSY